MAHTGSQALFIGVDCRACGGQIPVFSASGEAIAPSRAAIHIMCPDCGHAGEYHAVEAYRFARYTPPQERFLARRKTAQASAA